MSVTSALQSSGNLAAFLWSWRIVSNRLFKYSRVNGVGIQTERDGTKNTTINQLGTASAWLSITMRHINDHIKVKNYLYQN